MSKQPPKTPSAGTYSRNGKSDPPENAPAYENRFAEVQRKSAAARAKLNVAAKERARTEDQRAEDDRRDFAARDRQFDRDETQDTAPPSPFERAAAQLDPADNPSDDEGSA